MHVVPPAVDAEHYMAYSAGLGQLYNTEYDWYPNFSSTTLVGYRKGTEQWGSSCPHPMVLAVQAGRVLAAVTAIPNPFQQELSVRFELLQPQAVAVELRDALGRVVLTRPAVLQPAGAGSLSFSTSNLPAGLYSLWLQPADNPAQVLKVLKN